MILGTGTQQLETPRLILRKFAKNDAKNAFRHWCGDKEVTPYLKWHYHLHPLQTEQTLEYWVREYRDPFCFHWAITLKSTGDIIGGISLAVKDKFDENGELGYSLGSSYWRQGYGMEAAKAVLDYAFCTIGFHRIEAVCACENTASAHLLQRLGMQYEGRHRQLCRLSTGSFADCFSYSMLSEDYLALYHPQ